MIYVVIDVHKDSFSFCVLDSLNGQVILEIKCGAEVILVERFY